MLGAGEFPAIIEKQRLENPHWKIKIQGSKRRLFA